MHRSFTTRAALTAAAAACLALVPATSSAFATAGGTYTVGIHQNPPITATGFAEHEAKCGGIGADQDGWHFVLPGNSTDFVKLTVAFDNGAPQVVTTFGPPTTKHAYVASAPGAKLTSATAEVKGGEVKWFNLSHTCPATAVPPSPTASSPAPTTKPSTTASPTASPSTTTAPSATTSPTATGAPTSTASAGVSPQPTAKPTPSTAASTAANVDAARSPSAGPSTAATTPVSSDTLASTGADVGLAALAGVALIGAGGVLVMRRRSRSAQH
ncbi:LPXTG cell wall anchor domain-containing protein [Kitasatospora sp. NPDC050543]|uniref:LPXTG cell wall anchor domain-containing protein n=1 Tax=Kitasatospora sp. NPDC050543 TaxID=3364054 RepID=UPI0037AE5906